MTEVWEIMTKGIASVTAESTASIAAEKMAERDIGSLLVTKGNETVGLITERDLIRKVMAKKIDPTTVRLKELMTDDIVTVDKKTDINEASKLMTERGLKRIVITDNSATVGILSATDLIRFLGKQ